MFSKTILFKPIANSNKPDIRQPQIYDLLQISRQERDCQTIFLRTRKSWKDWKRKDRSGVDPFLCICVRMQGILLKRQVQDAIICYRMVRRHRIKIFTHYINMLPCRGAVEGRF